MGSRGDDPVGLEALHVGASAHRARPRASAPERRGRTHPRAFQLHPARRGAQPRLHNPMVNSCAIVTASLLTCANAEHGATEMRALFSRLAGRQLEIDEAVFRSERETVHRNRANAWLMLNSGMVVPGQVMLAVYSPKLDRVGNSVRGIEVCRSCARDCGLHTCTSVVDPDSAIRRFSGAREVASPPGPSVKYWRPSLGQRRVERVGRLPGLRNRSNPGDRRRVPARLCGHPWHSRTQPFTPAACRERADRDRRMRVGFQGAILHAARGTQCWPGGDCMAAGGGEEIACGCAPRPSSLPVSSASPLHEAARPGRAAAANRDPPRFRRSSGAAPG